MEWICYNWKGLLSQFVLFDEMLSRTQEGVEASANAQTTLCSDKLWSLD